MQVGRVMIPVSNQDEAIAWYSDTLGCTLAADIPFGDGERWVEVQPPAGGPPLALTPGQGPFQPGLVTGLALATSDARKAREDLTAKGADVDEFMGGDGVVPLMFGLRDPDGNSMLVVESEPAR
jgi:catechol 2,3-dioxygenase-like lactoylglutathione lyase family enzyme